MGPATVDSSDNASEGDDQTAAWEAEPASLARPRLGVAQAADDLMPHLQTAECGIGHRVRAARSVLALVLDEECVFAGLQGGDIVVSFQLPTALRKGDPRPSPFPIFFSEPKP